MCLRRAGPETSAIQWRATLILSVSLLRPCAPRLKTLSLRAPRLPLRLRRLSSRVKPRWLPTRAALYQVLGLFAYRLPLSCGTAHGHAVQLERGNANADRH